MKETKNNKMYKKDNIDVEEEVVVIMETYMYYSEIHVCMHSKEIADGAPIANINPLMPECIDNCSCLRFQAEAKLGSYCERYSITFRCKSVFT